MKTTYYSSLFSMHALIVGALSQAGKKKNIMIKPVFGMFGIKFDNISTGKLYPDEFAIKNIHDLRWKKIASHL